jgi:hypothetical protein
MILEIELAAVLALLAVPLVKRAGAAAAAVAPTLAPAAAAPVAVAAPAAGDVELLKAHGDGWLSIGLRNAEHPDYHEALRTPGLAVRHADGTIVEGGSEIGL